MSRQATAVWWSGTSSSAITVGKPTEAPTGLTLGELYPAVERDYIIRKKRSLRNVQGVWSNHLRAHFAAQPVAPYKPSRVEAYIVARQTDGAANATINRELAVLKRAATLAKKTLEAEVEDEKLVAALTRWQEIPLLDESDNVREQVFPDELYDKFAVETAREGLWFRTMFQFIYARGWRPGSLRKLHVRQVDLARRTVRLNAHQTKNKKPTEIAMTDTEYELVRRCCENKKPDDYLLAREKDFYGRRPKNGGRIVDYRGAWKRVCQRVGVESGKTGLILYDAKRAAITNLINDGFDVKDAMKITGQLTESAFRRYHQVSAQKMQEAARRIEQGFRERQRQLRYRQAEMFSTDQGRKPS